MDTIRQLSQYALQQLKDSYPEYEIKSLCDIIFMDVLHYTNIDIHLRKNEILEKSFINKFHDIIQSLKCGQPLQYIIGETEFAGLKFSLDSSTLIPRPETEELVLWASRSVSAGMSLLDIGTGSGCIAVTLAHLCPAARVCGVDISAEAIRMATHNAGCNHTKVDFIVHDMLHFETRTWENYDILVSNPPYIRDSEKEQMDARVLDYEPHRALFVPDADPLLFYRQIARFGRAYLSPGGLLFLEINEAMGAETISLLAQEGYQQIELKKDFFGKERMVKAERIRE